MVVERGVVASAVCSCAVSQSVRLDWLVCEYASLRLDPRQEIRSSAELPQPVQQQQLLPGHRVLQKVRWALTGWLVLGEGVGALRFRHT